MECKDIRAVHRNLEQHRLGLLNKKNKAVWEPANSYKYYAGYAVVDCAVDVLSDCSEEPDTKMDIQRSQIADAFSDLTSEPDSSLRISVPDPT